MNRKNLPDLLTAKEVIQLFRISRPTLYRKEKAGKIKSVDILGVKRFEKQEILKILNSKKPGRRRIKEL